MHSHILPGIDDGSKNVSMSLSLLQMESDNGVNRIFLTPHFYPQKMDVSTFLGKRQESFDILKNALGDRPHPTLRLGAEVRFELKLNDLPNPHQICLGATDYLLLELPFNHEPPRIKEYVSKLVMQGITPILAHVERYRYFREDPDRLFDLVARGAFAQINVKGLQNRRDRGFCKACLKHELVHFIASDCHHPINRPPNLGEMSKLLSSEEINYFQDFAEALWNNEPPLPIHATPIRNIFHWFF